MINKSGQRKEKKKMSKPSISMHSREIPTFSLQYLEDRFTLIIDTQEVEIAFFFNLDQAEDLERAIQEVL